MRRIFGETAFFLACLALGFLSSANGASPVASATLVTDAGLRSAAGNSENAVQGKVQGKVEAFQQPAVTPTAAAKAEAEGEPDESIETSDNVVKEIVSEDRPGSKPGDVSKASSQDEKASTEADDKADDKADNDDDNEDEDDNGDGDGDDDNGDDDNEDDKDKKDADTKTDDAKKPAKSPTQTSDKPNGKVAKKATPYKVKHDKLKIEVELDGIFVAGETEEVALRPEVWSRFKVLEAVEHGTMVKKGDVLVRFDAEKLEKDLANESLDQRIAELSLMQDEEEFPRLKRLLELSFEVAKRKNEQVQADYKYYHSTDRPFTVEIAHFRYKSAEEQLAAAQEELDQLQQMYEADELTEETEEIVLRRQRFAVETAELVLKLNKENRDYTLNVSLQRSDEQYETAKEEAELSYEQAKTAREVGMTRKSYEMEKKRQSRAKSVERHGKLLSDKGLMTVRAPTDGVVYYGQTSKGKWSQIASLQVKLKAFGTATPNTILMTIVKPGSLHIESSLAEKDLPDLKPGLKTTIIPTAQKELELAGKVSQVGSIPGASNKFSVELSFDNIQAPEWLVAGMTCDAKVVTYENKQALVVPLALVQTDEDDEKTKYVMRIAREGDEAEAGEPERRDVKLGRKQGKVVEVLKGLEAGDEIVKEKK